MCVHSLGEGGGERERERERERVNEHTNGHTHKVNVVRYTCLVIGETITGMDNFKLQL